MSDILFQDKELQDSQEYGFIIKLNNKFISDEDALPLRKQGIIDLLIIERFDYLDGPTEGYITVFNGAQAIENDEKNTEESSPLYEALFNKTYMFRNDGRDELSIEITPISKDDDKEPKKEIWSIIYNFVIRDIEDIKTNSNIVKAKKLYFWDKRYQELRENNVEFCTSTALTNRNEYYKIIHKKDEERTLNTGTALLYLLKNNGFSDYVIDQEFDKGSTKIFYTSPIHYKIYDDINYIIKHHLSESNNDICVLNYDRSLQRLRFMPISWYFKEAGNKQYEPGKFQLDHLWMENYGEGSYVPKQYYSPISYMDDINNNVDFKIGEYAKITSYQEADMSPFDNSQLMVSRPTVYYDIKNRKYNVYSKDNNINSLTDKLENEYVKYLYGKSPKPLLSLNQTKEQNVSVSYEYSHIPDQNVHQYKGIKKLLYSGLFLNQKISMWLNGISYRIPGRFYAIDKESGAEGKFASKFYGQWFSTEVKHLFLKGGQYFNHILAVKVHSFDDLQIAKDKK